MHSDSRGPGLATVISEAWPQNTNFHSNFEIERPGGVFHTVLQGSGGATVEKIFMIAWYAQLVSAWGKLLKFLEKYK